MLLILAAIEDPEVRIKLEELYERYELEMHREAFYILHDDYDAEDAVQNAFFQIWKRLDALHNLDEKEIKWYVLCTARNAAIDIYRKKKKRWQKEEAYDEEFMFSREEYLEGTEYGLYDKIVGLPDRERDALMLKYVYGFQYKEIAEQLDISTETVKKVLTRAKNKLEQLCKEEGLYND